MDRQAARDTIAQTFADMAAFYRPGAVEYLLSHYAEAHRYYHTETHVADILSLTRQFHMDATRPDIIQAAALWHDVIYQTQDVHGHYRPDSINVAESVAAFRDFVRDDAPDVYKISVAAMIYATDGHTVPDSDAGYYRGFRQDVGLFLDFDLAQFARPWEAFQHVSADIRQEFAWIDDRYFMPKRADILEQLSERDSLFTVVSCCDEWGRQARSNLRRMVTELRSQISSTN